MIYNKKVVIYDAPTIYNKISIHFNLFLKNSIFIIEPFVSYHRNGKVKFFPEYYPEYVKKLIHKNKIHVISSEELNAKEIYTRAANLAVKKNEIVYSSCRKKNQSLISYMVATLKSVEAERVLKKRFCDDLAIFYAVNLLFYKISKKFNNIKVRFYPDTNINDYYKFRDYHDNCNEKYHKCNNIKISKVLYIIGYFKNISTIIKTIVFLIVQIIYSLLFFWSTTKNNIKKKYLYGISIISPSRQIRGNKRSANFIVNNREIKEKEVVYLPLVPLSRNDFKNLKIIFKNIYCFKHYIEFIPKLKEWSRLFLYSIKYLIGNKSDINEVVKCFYNYYIWKKVLQNVEFESFITQGDFNTSHIGRNIALNEAGVKTWYFIDSINFGSNIERKDCECLHPFWTYLYYDNLISWNEKLSRYLTKHPASFSNYETVGCLWTGSTINEKKSQTKITDYAKLEFKNRFTILAFDSTFSLNGYTSYQEGILFAQHLFQIVEEFKNVQIIFKEKKNRSIHKILDPVNGIKLNDLYEKLSMHSRVFCNLTATDMFKGFNYNKYEIDNIDLISASDLVISFPFTSPTFESLSIKKNAIWHDPAGLYKETPYGKINEVTTHSYDELKNYINRKIKNKKYYNFINSENKELFDPYSDGRAVDRFRFLLLNKKDII